MDHQFKGKLAHHVAELMKRHPEQVGTVIAAAPCEICDDCGKPARINIGDNNGNSLGWLCDSCYNRMMGEVTGSDMPDIMPKQMSLKDRTGKTHDFEIEFMIFATGKSLTATEIGKTKRKADVFGKLGDSLNNMLETLKERIKKQLSITYMGSDGYFVDEKAVGYIEYNHERSACDVIIDGKPYSWAELEKNVSSHEGFKIKIEFGDIGDELD